jgi:GABA permease
VLSALNSGLFAASRMLMALAGRGDAPARAGRLDTRGVPVAAILCSTAFGYLTVAMSYVSPDRIFAFLVNSYGTVAIFVYVLIAIAELRLRRRLESERPERLRIRMWGYPWLTRLAIVGMLAIVAAMSVIPEQRISLLFGLISVAALLGAYAIRRLARAPEAR